MLVRTRIRYRAFLLLALFGVVQASAIWLIGAGQGSIGWMLQGISASLVLTAVSGVVLMARDRKLLVGFKPDVSDIDVVDWVGIRVGPTRAALSELGADAKTLASLYHVSIRDGALTFWTLPHHSPVLTLDIRHADDVQVGHAVWLGKASPAVVVTIRSESGGTVRLPIVMHDPTAGPLTVVTGPALEERAAVVRSAVRQT